MNVIARLFILGCADEAPFPIRAGIGAYWNRHPNPGGASRARAHSYSPDGMSGSATRRLDHVGIERQRQHAPSSSQGKNPHQVVLLRNRGRHWPFSMPRAREAETSHVDDLPWFRDRDRWRPVRRSRAGGAAWHTPGALWAVLCGVALLLSAQAVT